MKKILIIFACVFIWLSASSQDEGAAVAQQRFARSKTIYISGGPALTLGKNLGDYSDGIGFEGGFLKRINKVLSLGPSLSYLAFKYDENKTYPYYYAPNQDIVVEYFQKGGDITLISLGCNLKLNFVPVGDNTMFSLYGMAIPFVSMATRKDFTATGDFYGDVDGDGLYTDFVLTQDFDTNDIPQLKGESKLSGGIHLGFGAEFFSSKPVSVFFQTTFCYTFPIRYAATESYLKEEDQYVDAAGVIYYDAETTLFNDAFPIVNKGFGSLNLKLGVLFNF